MAIDAPTEHTPIYLKNRIARSGLPLGTLGCIAMGIPFFSAGIFVTLLGYGVIPNSGPVNAPPHIVAGFGALFWVVGLWMIVTGLHRFARARRIRAGQTRHPGQPWKWDHHWSGPELHGDQRARLRSVTIQTIGISGFITPFILFTWTTPGVPIIVRLGTASCALIVLGMLIWWFRCAARCLRYGRTRLRLSSFPVFSGDRLIAEVSAGARINPTGPLVATLRCVQERIVTEKTSEGSTTSVKCEQRYADTIEINTPVLGPAAPPTTISFDLPDDPSLASALSEHPARYWELELTCDTPGIDFRTAFLLPIYSRSTQPFAAAA